MSEPTASSSFTYVDRGRRRKKKNRRRGGEVKKASLVDLLERTSGSLATDSWSYRCTCAYQYSHPCGICFLSSFTIFFLGLTLLLLLPLPFPPPPPKFKKEKFLPNPPTRDFTIIRK